MKKIDGAAKRRRRRSVREDVSNRLRDETKLPHNPGIIEIERLKDESPLQK
jgi:hypothetical protein